MAWVNLVEAAFILFIVLAFLCILFYGKSELQHLFIEVAWIALFLSFIAFWFFFNIYLAPQPNRYVPELEMGLAMLSGTLFTLLYDLVKDNRSTVARRRGKTLFLLFTVATVIAISLPSAAESREITQPDSDILDSPEYVIAKWLETRVNGSRVFATGTISFWLNVFSDVPQLRGGSDQGSTNPWWGLIATEVNVGSDGQLATLWYKALNIRYVVVNYPNADTPYLDYNHPYKFENVLPNRFFYKGVGVFEVPLEHPQPVQLVDVQALKSLRPLDGVGDVRGLEKYVELTEGASSDGDYSYAFYGTDKLVIRVENSIRSEGILVEMTYDERWEAFLDGKRIDITPVGPSFMLVDPGKDGAYELTLVCGKTLSEWIGIATSIVTVATILAFSTQRFVGRRYTAASPRSL